MSPDLKPHLLLGHLPLFAADPLGFFERCVRDRKDIVPLRFFFRRVYILNHPDQIEAVLTGPLRDFRKTKGYRTPIMRRLFGQGLLTNEGESWTRQRRLAQPAFHRERIASYAAVITQFAHEMLAEWTPGQTRDVHSDIQKLTTRVVVRTLFNAEVPQEIRDLHDGAAVILNQYSKQFTTARLLRMIILRRAGEKKFEEVMRKLDGFIFRLIREARASCEDRGDLLSMLLRARDEDGQGMSDQQLRDELLTLMVAGLDTTALAVSWALYLLAKNSAAQNALRDELNQTLGASVPTFADLPQLRFAETVIKETMRLYPPAWVVGREAVSDTQIPGLRIRRGDSLVMSQWLKHRDPRYFPEPLSFRPARWLDGSTTDLPKYAYFPFGGGARTCIGNAFAMMEATLTLATIIQHSRVSCAADYEVQPWPTITLQPRGPIQLQIDRPDRMPLSQQAIVS